MLQCLMGYQFLFKGEAIEKFVFYEYLHETNLSLLELLQIEGNDEFSFVLEQDAPGTAADIIRTQVLWGKDRKFFSALSRRLLWMMDEQSPILTAAMVQTAVERAGHPLLVQLLLELPAYELALYSAIARLQCQQPDSSVREVVVDEVLTDFDKFTDAISKKVRCLTFCL